MKNARFTPALLAIDALLAIVLAALWLAPGAPARWRQWSAPAPQAPSLDDVRAAQLTPNLALRRDYPAIAQRPLFAADRKPHIAASDATDAAPPPPEIIDQVKLYGLIGGAAAQGVLLEQNGQSQFVRLGEKIGSWTLQAIEGRDAIFVKDGGERRALPLPDSLSNTGAAGVSGTPGAAGAPRAASAAVSAGSAPVFMPAPVPGQAAAGRVPSALSAPISPLPRPVGAPRTTPPALGPRSP